MCADVTLTPNRRRSALALVLVGRELLYAVLQSWRTSLPTLASSMTSPPSITHSSYPARHCKGRVQVAETHVTQEGCAPMNQNSAVDRRATRDLVNLFVVGIQKSGTTTLGSFLAEHPELLRGDAQEIHFFDDEDVDWDEPNYDHFHERFPMRTSPGAPFDVSPIYFFWPPAMPRIRSYNPDAQMVILFRDPIERGWSHWRMEAARGREHLPFSEAIREGRARLPADKPTAPEWRVASYVERGFYAQQLERALGLFPREQLLFLKTSGLSPAWWCSSVVRSPLCSGSGCCWE
jgi:hypothetical protein